MLTIQPDEFKTGKNLRIFLSGGATLEGTFIEFDVDALVLKTKEGRARIATDDIVATEELTKP